jgi:hypothetical protein
MVMLQGKKSVMRKREDASAKSVQADIFELAALCDRHAAEFGNTLRRLHAEIVAVRQRNGGRGPSGLMVWSGLARCATRYFEGTVLRSLRGSSRLPQQPTFAQQVERWLSMLNASNPPPPSSPSPPHLAA